MPRPSQLRRPCPGCWSAARPGSTPSATSICAADRVVALVRVVAEGDVRLVRVQPGVLQRVGVELGVQADAAALLPQVQQVARRRPAIRSTASRSCGPQSQRWLPNTSPVRHSLCGRTSGARRPRRSARSPRPSARCSRPSTSPSKREHPRGRRVAVREAQRHRHLGADRRDRQVGRHASSSVSVVRTGRTARTAAARRRRSAGRRPASPGGPAFHGNCPSPTNRRARESPTKNGATTSCSSSARSAGEELGVHRAAALDHQPADPAGVAGPR